MELPRFQSVTTNIIYLSALLQRLKILRYLPDLPTLSGSMLQDPLFKSSGLESNVANDEERIPKRKTVANRSNKRKFCSPHC
jgi:hypothetical protein